MTGEHEKPRILHISKKNATWQKFAVLKTNRNKRHRYQQFFVEGVRNINEAIRNNWTVDAWIYAGQSHLSDWAREHLNVAPAPVHYVLSSPLMNELSSKTDASELAAIVQMREPGRLDNQEVMSGRAPLQVLFDRPSNKGNLGTLIRTCDALGVDCLVLTGHGVDRYDPDVIAASTGSFFRLPILFLAGHDVLLDWIGQQRQAYPSLCVIGTTAHQATPIDQLDLRLPVLWVVGNETDGMSRWLYSQCSDLATIPMSAGSSASSLNVACAATVLLYETRRQRLSCPPDL